MINVDIDKPTIKVGVRIESVSYDLIKSHGSKTGTPYFDPGVKKLFKEIKNMFN